MNEYESYTKVIIYTYIMDVIRIFSRGVRNRSGGAVLKGEVDSVTFFFLFNGNDEIRGLSRDNVNTIAPLQMYSLTYAKKKY